MIVSDVVSNEKKDEVQVRYFSVVWCKRSSKKVSMLTLAQLQMHLQLTTFETIVANGEIASFNNYRLCSVVVERPSHVGHTKTLKMVVMDALLGAQGCGVGIYTNWLMS